jgi:2,3-bisphosphoglycerate-independent phosphoglycerate mutase
LQLYKLVEGGVERGIKKVRVHALADGRDVQDGSSVKFFKEIKDKLQRISDTKGVDACIASGGGRMKVTMDRYEVFLCCCIMYLSSAMLSDHAWLPR